MLWKWEEEEVVGIGDIKRQISTRCVCRKRQASYSLLSIEAWRTLGGVHVGGEVV